MSEQSREAQRNTDPEVARHPCSSADQASDPYQLASAEGVRLTLADGRQLIDGMASQCCAIHGYNHPGLNRAFFTIHRHRFADHFPSGSMDGNSSAV